MIYLSIDLGAGIAAPGGGSKLLLVVLFVCRKINGEYRKYN
jgi:hypothetical protein